MDNYCHIDNVLKEKISSDLRSQGKVLKLFLLLPAFLFIFPLASSHTDSSEWIEKGSVIATVNDFHITVGEFELYLHESRTEVISGFIRKYRLNEISPDFWRKEFDGIKPIDVLKEVAIQKAVHKKTRLVYMYEKGIIESPDYKYFLKKYSDLCENRDNSGTTNIKYGPVQFSERDFFNYWYSNSLIELKNRIYYENDPYIPLAAGEEMQSGNPFSSSDDAKSKNTPKNEIEVEKIFQHRIQLYDSIASIKINRQLLKDFNPSF
ncbi:MAG: hypothetical protein ACOCUP_00405 [bacterium]